VILNGMIERFACMLHSLSSIARPLIVPSYELTPDVHEGEGSIDASALPAVLIAIVDTSGEGLQNYLFDPSQSRSKSKGTGNLTSWGSVATSEITFSEHKRSRLGL
jgi:hypothetical protein